MPLSEQDRDDAVKVGELIGAFVCAVITYAKVDSQNHKREVMETCGDLVEGLAEVYES